MLPPGPLPMAPGAWTVAASIVRPIGSRSTMSALVVVATVAVVAVPVNVAVTSTTSVSDASAILTLNGCRSAIFKPITRVTGANPWSSKVTV